MLGFSMGEILFLGILALILIGPDELPKVARQIGRFLNDIKRTTSEFTNEIKEQAKFDPKAYLEEHRLNDDVPEAPTPPSPHVQPRDQMSDDEYQNHIGGHHHAPPPTAPSATDEKKTDEGKS